MAMNYEDIEKMKQENKQMRLELQRLKMLASDAGSNYNGETTPRSLSGVVKLSRHKASKDLTANESSTQVKVKHDASYSD